MDEDYGATFRDAYALLHGGRGEADEPPPRPAGEALEDYLARSRAETVGAARRMLLAATPPPPLATAHRLLQQLLENATLADEALAQQVKAYGCGDFQGSIAHSDRLHDLVAESARLDRELIAELRSLDEGLRATVGLELPEGG